MKTGRILSLMLSGLLLVGTTGCVDQSPKNTATSGGELPRDYRIAATSVATCEILEALEVEASHVVGVPHSDAYKVPEIYAQATSLGSPMAPDMEILKSLQVDYVLTPNSLEGDLKPQYETLRINSYFLNLKSVDGMYASILELGKLLGKEQQAQSLYSQYQAYQEELQQQVQSKQPLKVLILMGLPGSYVVATESSYVGSLVKIAGAENVYGDGDGSDFLNVNVEDMLQRKPDLILRTSHAMPEQVKVMFREEFASNDIWKHFAAVQQGRVYDLNHETSGMSATFRYTQALEELKAILYGA